MPVRHLLTRRQALLGLSVTCAAGFGVYGYHDEGIHRAFTFWSHVGPIYAHYLLTDWRLKKASPTERDAAFNILHDRYAPKAQRLVLKLRGFFIKVAQMASTRDDFVPEQYMTFFKLVQDQAPPAFTPAEVVKVVETSLNQPISDVFQSFSETPCGSATIGQVHRAILKDGSEVAVKVQAPDAEHGFRSDLGLVIDFCKLAMPQHVTPLREFERQFATEFDYRLEARQLAKIADNITPVWGAHVVVPRPRLNLCTKNILVMDFLRGVKLIDGIRAQYRPIAAKMGISMDEYERRQKGKQPPSEWMMATLIRVFRFKTTLLHVMDWIFNQTLGRLLGRPFALSQTWGGAPPVNIRAIINLLIRVHAYELFIDGAFNADPHPGNILLLDDGRLGLIDYGQVGRLTVEDRVRFARLIVALKEKNKPEVVRVMTQELGFATKKMDPEILYLMGVFHHDNDSPAVEKGLNPLAYMDWLDAMDPVQHVPRQFVMVGRLAMMLRGFANAFALNLSLANCYYPYAKQVLDKHGHLYGHVPIEGH